MGTWASLGGPVDSFNVGSCNIEAPGKVITADDVLFSGLQGLALVSACHNVFDARRRVRIQLPSPLPQQELDGRKVSLLN